MRRMITIDGSFGEGGGQILRTSLTLSLLTKTPITLENLRARRAKPGLRRQHLTAVLAAQEISGATVEGADIGSQRLVFAPGDVEGGSFRFDIGSAGSATLVLQTLLLPLLFARRPSSVVIEGGTHNPLAPPFEFLDEVFRPRLLEMGAKMELRLERPGFAPKGGGRVVAEVEPLTGALQPLFLDEEVPRWDLFATAVVSRLPRHIAERELSVLAEALSLPEEGRLVVEETRALGPGNVVMVRLSSSAGRELVVGFGEKGRRAEDVADGVAQETLALLAHRGAVGEHLADQLLLPLALAGKGSFRTGPLSLHATTQMALIPRFLPVAFGHEDVTPQAARVFVYGRAAP